MKTINGSLLILIGGVFIVAIVFYVSHREYAASSISPSTVDGMKLENVTDRLRDYADNHAGQFPQPNMSLATEGFVVKAVCVITNLPERKSPAYVHVPPPHLSEPYPFLYFPIDSPENANLPLSSSDDKNDVTEKILTASVNTFYFPNWKTEVRNVEFYAGGGALLRESDFQNFLAGKANVK